MSFFKQLQELYALAMHALAKTDIDILVSKHYYCTSWNSVTLKLLESLSIECHGSETQSQHNCDCVVCSLRGMAHKLNALCPQIRTVYAGEIGNWFISTKQLIDVLVGEEELDAQPFPEFDKEEEEEEEEEVKEQSPSRVAKHKKAKTIPAPNAGAFLQQYVELPRSLSPPRRQLNQNPNGFGNPSIKKQHANAKRPRE
jgi:hypothetical protein